MGKYGVWIVLISMLEIKGAFSEECPTNKPGNSVSFCTASDQNGIEFILGTWDAPPDTRWNCQCNIFTKSAVTGTYVYRPGNTGPCSTTLSISNGYINNNCTSQTLSQPIGSQSVALTKNTTQNGVHVCFVIKGSELLNVKCKTNSNQVPTSTPYDRGSSTTFGQQSTTHNNQGITITSKNEQTEPLLHIRDTNVKDNKDNTASIIVMAAAVGSAVVICIVIIIVVVCYFRRRLIKMQQYVQSITLSGQYENSAAMHEGVMLSNNQIPQNSQSSTTISSIGRTDDVTNQQLSYYDYIDDSVVNHSRGNIQQTSEYVNTQLTRNDPTPSTSQYDYIDETGIKKDKDGVGNYIHAVM